MCDPNVDGTSYLYSYVLDDDGRLSCDSSDVPIEIHGGPLTANLGCSGSSDHISMQTSLRTSRQSGSNDRLIASMFGMTELDESTLYCIESSGVNERKTLLPYAALAERDPAAYPQFSDVMWMQRCGNDIVFGEVAVSNPTGNHAYGTYTLSTLNASDTVVDVGFTVDSELYAEPQLLSAAGIWPVVLHETLSGTSLSLKAKYANVQDD